MPQFPSLPPRPAIMARRIVDAYARCAAFGGQSGRTGPLLTMAMLPAERPTPPPLRPDPHRVAEHYQLAGEYYQARRLDDAETEYRRAREFVALDDRRNQAALAYNVGQCLWLRGEFDRAATEFRRCLAMDPAESYRAEAEKRLADLAEGIGPPALPAFVEHLSA